MVLSKEVCTAKLNSNKKRVKAMIIEVNNISKSYGKVNAINDWNFSVKEGELYGLIGPDGAGKTSMFRILTTMLLADKGTATVCGLDCKNDYAKIREIIGYMPGRFSLYQDLTVKENLRFFATIFGTTIEENRYLVDDIYKQIEKFNDRKAGALSGGMKQKLALCCALIHKPKVLFLDEPTTGVDVVSRREFWQMLKRLKEQGITILVSTPYMDEAEMCDRIALVNQGKFLKVDTVAGIISAYPKNLYSVKSNNLKQTLNALRDNKNIDSVFSFGESLHVTFKDENTLLGKQCSKDIELSRIQPTIEDCFMELIND